MKHVIIGTAGHVDHGKTELIKALTGQETDRLKEEKERGISIDLGFASFDLPSGRRAGIIDVPGHEKFIKNMLAGVSSVDVVLLVIAADTGIMPQTREHFQILQLLNVKKVVIVITKCDLVEDEWLSIVEEDIREEFKDTIFHDSPLCRVSSKNRMGLEALVEIIDKNTEEVEAKDTEGHFRLPVDRSFSVTGFGTVITGTIISGSVKVGDWIQIYSSMILTKVRGIQVHEKTVEFAEAGQRCALNLANISACEVKRGDVISKENVMEPSSTIDCHFYYLNSAGKPLENRQRLRLYHGTKEILCRAILLDSEGLNPGENAYVQLRLEEFLTSQRGDRFVIRSYSPMHTIGGGVIIEPNAAKARRFDDKYISDVKLKEKGKTEDVLERTIEKNSAEYPDINLIIKSMGRNEENIDNKISQLIDEKKVIKLSSGEKAVFLHKSFINNRIDTLTRLLFKFHRDNSLKHGISKEELKNRLFGKNLKQKNYDELLGILEERNIIRIKNHLISLYEFEVKYTVEQKEIKSLIYHEFYKGELSPPKYEELALKYKDKTSFIMVFEGMLEEGVLVRLNSEVTMSSEHYEKAKTLILKYIKEKGAITVGEARDLLKANRKTAVAILEHFDVLKLTKRLEDKRVLF
ncbi:MAG: selenocysteine-specific translation elongation factor [Bacillota bacterium]|nr:selenocysteine-specific translation elongation factor [Bacillota bacterium]